MAIFGTHRHINSRVTLSQRSTLSHYSTDKPNGWLGLSLQVLSVMYLLQKKKLHGHDTSSIKRYFYDKFTQALFSLWNHLLKEWGPAGSFVSEGTPYWTTAAKSGQRGKISSPWDKGIWLWDSLKHTTQQEHLRDKPTRTETSACGPCPEALESHRSCRSPPLPVALEPGMACHLELGGGFVRGVLKPSGTCFDRAADHLARHTVYQ